METLHFYDYEEFACAVADKMDEIIRNTPYSDISIIAKYEEARQIIRELICIGYDLESVSIHDEEYENYESEYVISVVNDGENYELWCEPMLRESGYISDDSTVIYVLENCSSKVIPYCKGTFVYEVSVGDDTDEDDCDLECCDNDTHESESVYVSRNRDGVPVGFQKAWYDERDGVRCYSSFSHYTSNVDLLREIAKEFGVIL